MRPDEIGPALVKMERQLEAYGKLILAHEDRGMMELIEVIKQLKNPYEHS